MPFDAATCYAALLARDRRFDGVFFVAVKTTGIYCRPICPARTPGRDRCEFFDVSAEAEQAGYRACFRCRPELAPGHAPVDAVSGHVRSAVSRIEAGYLNEHSVDELAALFGVTARHLRRSMEAEIGVSPIEFAQTRRLALAKQLLHDSQLPLTEVALASGFSSLRRFNSAFVGRFKRPPSAIRREVGGAADVQSIRVRLDYRPPFAWDALLRFLAVRSIPGVERVEGDSYQRTVTLGDRSGIVRVHQQGGNLEAHIALNLAPRLSEIVSRLRRLFDLDARPDLIGATLSADPLLRSTVLATPGRRVPGAFDGFEVAVRAILGQQVSVRAATTLAGRLVERFGSALPGGEPGLSRLFPTVEALATAALDEVRAIGLPATRAQTIIGLARAVSGGHLSLDGAASPALTMEHLRLVPGIGPWTAQYVTMRALRWPDAYPAGDLVICKALGVTTAKASEARAERWRPWRSYAVLHLWSSQ